MSVPVMLQRMMELPADPGGRERRRRLGSSPPAARPIPPVRECAVVGVPDEEFGQRLAAFVVREGAALTGEEVRDYVVTHRARHCVPREVVLLDEFPWTATGKILARELQARFR